MKRRSLIDLLGGANRRTLAFLAIACAGVIIAEYLDVNVFVSMALALVILVILEGRR